MILNLVSYRFQLYGLRWVGILSACDGFSFVCEAQLACDGSACYEPVMGCTVCEAQLACDGSVCYQPVMGCIV